MSKEEGVLTMTHYREALFDASAVQFKALFSKHAQHITAENVVLSMKNGHF